MTFVEQKKQNKRREHNRHPTGFWGARDEVILFSNAEWNGKELIRRDWIFKVENRF